MADKRLRRPDLKHRQLLIFFLVDHEYNPVRIFNEFGARHLRDHGLDIIELSQYVVAA
jgi:hypothetical protein